MAERVGLYLRISEDRDGSQTATERQREDCERYAAARGWQIVDMFQDVDLSAYKRNVRRPEFERLLGAVRMKSVDGVLAWKMDRITRRQRDLVRLDEACEDAHGFIATVVEGIDTRQPASRFISELLVAQARMESENQSLRIRRQQQQRAKLGLPRGGGTRAFGYTQDRMQLVPAEADLIREAARRLLAGESLRGICFDFGRRQVATPAGNAWTQSTLRRALMSPMLSAQRDVDGQLIHGVWPPILTPAETQQLQALLGDPARRTSTGTPRRYLLTGLLVCDLCGERLVARPRADGTRRYVCARRPDSSSCGKIARLAEPIERAVAEMIFGALQGVDLSAYLSSTQGDVAEIIDSIRNDEAGLEELARDYYEARRISRAEFFAARQGVETRLQLNRQQLSGRAESNALVEALGAGEELRARWESASLDWQRAVINALIERVVVLPARRGRQAFDPTLLRPIWKA